MEINSELPPLRRRINIDEPRWDQGVYWGRVKHFFGTTNPMNLLCSEKDLEDAKNIVTKHRYSDFWETTININMYGNAKIYA